MSTYTASHTKATAKVIVAAHFRTLGTFDQPIGHILLSLAQNFEQILGQMGIGLIIVE